MTNQSESFPAWLLKLLGVLASCLLVISIAAILLLGREILIPLALAILLSFVVAPAVTLLQRLRVPQTVAITTVVITAFAALTLLGFVVAGQLAGLVEDLPKYRTTISTKVTDISQQIGKDGPLSRMFELFHSVSRDVDNSARSKAPATLQTYLKSVKNPQVQAALTQFVAAHKGEPVTINQVNGLAGQLLGGLPHGTVSGNLGNALGQTVTNPALWTAATYADPAFPVSATAGNQIWQRSGAAVMAAADGSQVSSKALADTAELLAGAYRQPQHGNYAALLNLVSNPQLRSKIDRAVQAHANDTGDNWKTMLSALS